MTLMHTINPAVFSAPHTRCSDRMAYVKRAFVIVMTLVSLTMAGADSDSSHSEFVSEGKQRFTHYLGGAAGYTSGLGLSYRRWFGNTWGFQVTGFPWYREYTYPEDDNNSYGLTSVISGNKTETVASFGVLVLKGLAELKYVRFLGYLGGSSLYQYHRSDYVQTNRTYDYEIDKYISDTVHVDHTYKSNKITLGIGAGAEWYIWRFGFHLQLGFAGSHDIVTGSNAVQPTVDGGVYFRFNTPRRK
jgi:hypothetical protein